MKPSLLPTPRQSGEAAEHPPDPAAGLGWGEAEQGPRHTPFDALLAFCAQGAGPERLHVVYGSGNKLCPQGWGLLGRKQHYCQWAGPESRVPDGWEAGEFLSKSP